MTFGRQNLVEILIRARDEASKELAKVTSNLERVEKRALVASAAVGAIGTAAVAGLATATVRGSRFADEIASLSDRLQVTTGTVATLGTAFVQMGGQIGDQEVAVRTFQRAIADAAAGNRVAVSAFEALGISVEDLVAEGGGLKSIEDLLPDVADGLAKAANGAVKIDAAMTLFGRSGTTILPVLDRGREGLRRWSDEAERLGIAIGDKRTHQIAELDGSINLLRLSTQGAAVALAGALSPALNEVALSATKAVTETTAFVQRNPSLVTGAFKAASALASIGGGVAGILAIRKAALLAIPTIQALGLTSLFAARQLELVNGAVVVTRAVTWTRVIGVLSVAAAAAAVVIGGLAYAHDRAARQAQEDENAEADFKNAMESSTASVEEQIEALNRLRDARVNAQKRRDTTRQTVASAEARILLRQQIDSSQAEKDFERDFGEARRRLVNKARLVARASIDTGGDTIILPAPQLEFAPLDDNTLQAQIKRQQEIVERDLAKVSTASVSLKVALEAGAPSGIVDAEEALQQARDKHAQSSIRLAALTDQLREKRERLAATARDNADALRLLDAKTIEDMAAIQRQAVETTTAELDLAKVRATEVKGSVEAQAEVTEALAEAIARYQAALSGLDATEREMASRRRQQADSARDLEDAYHALAQAQERAATADAAGGDSKAREAALRALDVRQQREELEHARARVNAGPLPEREQAQALRELASAQDAYTDAVYGTADAQVASSERLGAQLGESLLGDATSALVSFSDDWDATFERMGLNALQHVARIATELIVTQATAEAVGVSTAATAVSTSASAAGAAVGASAAAAAATEASVAAAAAAASAVVSAQAATQAAAAAASAGGVASGIGAVAAGFSPLSLLALPLLLFQHGGKVPLSLGTRGRDSVPALLAPGERVIPDGLNQRLEQMVSGGGARGGGVTVNYNSGISLASGPETRRAQRRIKRMLDDFERDNIAVSSLD